MKTTTQRFSLLSLAPLALACCGFCVFNMSSTSDFTLKVTTNHWSLPHYCVVLPGEQCCSMKDLKPGEPVHFHIETTVDHDDWLEGDSKDIDDVAEVDLFLNGWGKDFTVQTTEPVSTPSNP